MLIWINFKYIKGLVKLKEPPETSGRPANPAILYNSTTHMIWQQCPNIMKLHHLQWHVCCQRLYSTTTFLNKWFDSYNPKVPSQVRYTRKWGEGYGCESFLFSGISWKKNKDWLPNYIKIKLNTNTVDYAWIKYAFEWNETFNRIKNSNLD